MTLMARGTFEGTRRRTVVLGNDGTLAVLNDVDEYVPLHKGRLIGVSASLRATGGTSGQTTIDIKKSPAGGLAFASVLSATLGIAFNAAAGLKNVSAGSKDGQGLAGSAKEPSGVEFAAGDIFRLDVLAIPGVASAGLSVYLEIIETE